MEDSFWLSNMEVKAEWSCMFMSMIGVCLCVPLAVIDTQLKERCLSPSSRRCNCGLRARTPTHEKRKASHHMFCLLIQSEEVLVLTSYGGFGVLSLNILWTVDLCDKHTFVFNGVSREIDGLQRTGHAFLKSSCHLHSKVPVAEGYHDMSNEF